MPGNRKSFERVPGGPPLCHQASPVLKAGKALRTDTDNGKSLVDQDRVLRHLASRPVGTTVPQSLGERDGARAELGKVLGGVGVCSKDSTPVDSQDRYQSSQARQRPEEAFGVRGLHLGRGTVVARSGSRDSSSSLRPLQGKVQRRGLERAEGGGMVEVDLGRRDFFDSRFDSRAEKARPSPKTDHL